MKRWKRSFGWVVSLLCLGASISVFGRQDQEESIRILRSINGISFELKSGKVIDSYKYDHVDLERCALSWTEEHETRESGKRTLAEFSAISIELALLDVLAIRNESLKPSGYQVSLVTKGLREGFSTKERIQWGDGPATESVGFSTGKAFYFRDAETARKVAKAIATLARSCQK